MGNGPSSEELELKQKIIEEINLKELNKKLSKTEQKILYLMYESL